MIRMEKIPITRPVIKGKKTEPGAVSVPDWRCMEPTKIARDTARRKRPESMSYFRIISPSRMWRFQFL
jgi:hypothetical protein